MASRTQDPFALPTLNGDPWQMSLGERAALEGLLAQLTPRLAIEIGTAEGGSLKRLAAHSAEVHSFDLVPPPPEVAGLENVTFHTGDSHRLLGEFLDRLVQDERLVDFILIDGDHTANGVRRDLLDVLESEAVIRTVVVLHDTLNPDVRAGIAAAAPGEHHKVALYEPDLVPGYVPRQGPWRLELWGGLGLIVVDPERRGGKPGDVRNRGFHELFSVLRPTVEVMVALDSSGTRLGELDDAEVESAIRRGFGREQLGAAKVAYDQLLRELEGVRRSRGWRAVLALRRLKERLSRQ